MDKLYIGNIPKEYHFARFYDGHIDLYKTNDLSGTLDFYRIYTYENLFAFEHLSTTYSQYNQTTAIPVEVTDDFMYRRDFPSIVFLSTIYIIFIVLIFNIVTSVFKRGGLLSGLL